MYYTNDPLADFHRHEAELQAKLDKLPKCVECDEPIQDDYCYEINSEYICEDCLKEYYRKSVEDLMEG